MTHKLFPLTVFAFALNHTACDNEHRAVTPPVDPAQDAGVDAANTDTNRDAQASTNNTDVATDAGLDTTKASDADVDAAGSVTSAADGGTALYCGEFVRVDSDDRGEIPDYVRIRDEAALAARQWSCVGPLETPEAGASTPVDTIDATTTYEDAAADATTPTEVHRARV